MSLKEEVRLKGVDKELAELCGFVGIGNVRRRWIARTPAGAYIMQYFNTAEDCEAEIERLKSEDKISGAEHLYAHEEISGFAPTRYHEDMAKVEKKLMENNLEYEYAEDVYDAVRNRGMQVNCVKHTSRDLYWRLINAPLETKAEIALKWLKAALTPNPPSTGAGD